MNRRKARRVAGNLAVVALVGACLLLGFLLWVRPSFTPAMALERAQRWYGSFFTGEVYELPDEAGGAVWLGRMGEDYGLVAAEKEGLLYRGTAVNIVRDLGQRVLGFFAELLEVSDWLLTLWHYLRFLLLAVIMFAALGALYAMSQDRRQPVSSIVPGAVAALAAWLAVSIGFSFYVENFANYTIVYGTLGAVVVLMVWLYLTATILIMGAELNAALRTARSGGIWREDEEL